MIASAQLIISLSGFGDYIQVMKFRPDIALWVQLLNKPGRVDGISVPVFSLTIAKGHKVGKPVTAIFLIGNVPG